MTKVSVLMPAFNAEEYIGTAIESVVKQSYTNWELLIIDDCSADKTGSICDQFAIHDKRIQVIHLNRNVGISEAKNIGLQNATGEYIAFCDDDDQMHMDSLRDNVNLVERYHPQIVRWSYERIDVDENGVIVGRKDRNCRDGVYLDRDAIFRNYDNVHSVLSCDWTGLYERSFLKKNDIWFNKEFTYGGEDTEFNLSALQYVEKMVMNSKCYYKWYLRRMHSTTAKRNIVFCSSMIEVAQKEYSLIGNHELAKGFWKDYEAYYKKYILNYAKGLNGKERKYVDGIMSNDNWYKTA